MTESPKLIGVRHGTHAARPSLLMVSGGLLALQVVACSKPTEVDLLRGLDRWELSWPTCAIDPGARSGHRYFLDGWGAVSNAGSHALRWAVAPSARLRFQRRPEPLILRLFGISPDDREVKVELTLNGRALGRARFPPQGNEVAIALPPAALAAGGEQRLSLDAEREVLVETPRPGGRTRREPRYFGLIYMTVGAPAQSADQLRGWERDAFRPTDSGLFAPSRSSLTTYWRPGPATAIEFELRQPARNRGRLGARVRSWCNGHAARWSEELEPGRAAAGRVDLNPCAGRPTAIALEVDGPGAAGQRLVWSRARLVGSRPATAPELPRPTPFERGTPLVLIVLDAAGAKHFQCYGYRRATTPQLDRLAGEGVLFERAYSPAAFTVPAVGSILTGRYPESHAIVDLPAKLPAAAPSLAEVLREAGYRTASLVGNHHAGAPFGYNQGFDQHRIWQISGRARALRADRSYENYADNLVDAALQLLTAQARRPFFLYLHLREPHGPYAPPEPYRSQFATAPIGALSGSRRELIALEEGTLNQPDARERMVALYDGNLAYADAQVGRLLERMRALGLYDRSWIVVTADHGESFLEHGTTRHSTTVYEENVHIPLLMKLPAGTPAAQSRVAQLASLIDLMPTLLAGVGLEVPEGVEGIDLRPFLYVDRAALDRSIYAITVPELDGAALIQSRYKLIRMGAAQRPELYDLSADPAESRDLARQRPLLAGLMRQQLMTLRARIRSQRSWKPDTAVLDQETRQALRALGYAN